MCRQYYNRCGAGVLGTVLFNFGFVTTVPSWINEKRSHVSVNKTYGTTISLASGLHSSQDASDIVADRVWFSSFCCNLVFFAIGIVSCMAFWPYLQGVATNNCCTPPFLSPSPPSSSSCCCCCCCCCRCCPALPRARSPA